MKSLSPAAHIFGFPTTSNHYDFYVVSGGQSRQLKSRTSRDHIKAVVNKAYDAINADLAKPPDGKEAGNRLKITLRKHGAKIAGEIFERHDLVLLGNIAASNKVIALIGPECDELPWELMFLPKNEGFLSQTSFIARITETSSRTNRQARPIDLDNRSRFASKELQPSLASLGFVTVDHVAAMHQTLRDSQKISICCRASERSDCLVITKDKAEGYDLDCCQGYPMPPDSLVILVSCGAVMPREPLVRNPIATEIARHSDCHVVSFSSIVPKHESSRLITKLHDAVSRITSDGTLHSLIRDWLSSIGPFAQLARFHGVWNHPVHSSVQHS